MAIRVRIEGFAEMAKKLRSCAVNYKKKARAALNLEGERVMTVSKDEFVPVKESTLKNSGRVDVDDDPEKIKIYLSYGGAADAYAIVQHEHEEFQHKTGESKFLEKPLKAAIPQIVPNVAAAAQLSEDDLK